MQPQTAVAIAKLIKDQAEQARESLAPGLYTVDETVTLKLDGSVNVGADYEQRIVNKARPWALLHVALTELNTLCAATGRVGIDMAALVRAAEALDPKIEKQAQAEAEKFAAELKEATISTCSGKTTIKGNLTEVVAPARRTRKTAP